MTACGLAWFRGVVQADNRYSQFVFWAKITLPVAAIALLSTLFLFGSGETEPLPIADLEEIARDNRLSAPALAGMAEDGTEFELNAKSAKPVAGNDNRVIVEDIHLILKSSGGGSVDVDAGTADVDTDNKVVRMDGLARISTSNGYIMETRGLVAEYGLGQVKSFGPLEVRAPIGSIVAGRIFIKSGDDGGGMRMLFQDGVRLVYTPSN